MRDRGEDDDLAAQKAVSSALRVVGDMEPVAVSPFTIDGSRLAPLRTVMVALGAGVLGLFIGGFAMGAVAAVLTAVSLGLRRGQVVVRAVCLALLVLAFGFIVTKQFRNGYELDFDWVKWFEVTHDWALLATLLLFIDVAVDGLRRRTGTAPPPD